MINNSTPINLFLSQLFSTKPTNNVVISVNTNLTADLFATTLTINTGVTLFTDNWRIYCLGTITNNGTISNVGTNGGNGTSLVGGIAGVNVVNHSLLRGNSGSAGRNTNGSGVNGPTIGSGLCVGGTDGGSAGAFSGGVGGLVVNPTVNYNLFFVLFRLFDITYILSSAYVLYTPSSSGGSGAADNLGGGGGGSAAGGGCVFIFSSRIINNGTITVIGGNGGSAYSLTAAAAGGGAGGNGGLILLFFNTLIEGTLSVDGGLGGSGFNGGSNGDDGNVGQLLKFNFSY